MKKENKKQKKGKIGLSLSRCIKDIIEGKVDEKDVEKIIARTAANNEEEWFSLIGRYKQKYWSNNPEEAEAIFHRFMKAGKITQPRLESGKYPDIRDGIWTEKDPRYIP